MSTQDKIKIAIIGTGNIGTDLLIKAKRSPYLQCTLFTGRNFASPSIKLASEMGFPVSDRGIDAIREKPECCDLVFDATSAHAHIEHWKTLQELGKVVIDMTPAKLGGFCIPAIDPNESLSIGRAFNVNMVTCGGQASVPIAHALSKVHTDIAYIEVASSIASRSAGPATRYNLDEYIQTTEDALAAYSGVARTKAILILNPATPPIDMQTTIYAKIADPNIAAIREEVGLMVSKLRAYVPGYELVVPPTLESGRVITTIKVRGNGDYLPQYAGNLDIINCAAIAKAEQIAQSFLKDR